jgi:radical SAM protein with 4Fe4S-binding SPASM domain
MRKSTKHRAKFQEMYVAKDGRKQGTDGWKKLPLFWFILFLSYRCTRKCPYCYSFNQVGFDNQLEMEESTFSRLLEWIPEMWRVNDIKVNIVNFLGGEPLLRTDRIKRVMDAVCAHTDGMQGLVNTNGDLVDRLQWEDLEDIQWMTINITDLPIEELARRMAIIAERSNVINQTIAATLDADNLERILDVTRFGIENGYRLRYNKNLFKGLDSEYRQRVLKKYHEICDLLEDYIVRGYNVHTTFLFDFLIPLWDLDDSPYPCGKNLATVFPDGSIGPCIRDHSCKTGTIFDPDPMSQIRCDQFHYDVQKTDIPDECRECSVKSVCQGGCPHDKLLLTGTRAGKSVVCDIHREIIPRLRLLDQQKTEG